MQSDYCGIMRRDSALSLMVSSSTCVSTCCIMHFSHSGPINDIWTEVKTKAWMRQSGEVYSVC